MKKLLLLAVFVTMGCAPTRIISQDPEAEIFLDGQPIGFGEASVTRIGPPREARLEARRDGKMVGESHLSRSFTGMTVVWGLCSYYTGLYWGWYFPESVTIAVRSAVPELAKEFETSGPGSSWAEPGSSAWMRPLK